MTVKSSESLNPWERQPVETFRAFSMFQDYYLPMPKPRSLRGAYQRYYEDRYGKQPKERYNKQGQMLNFKGGLLEASGTWMRWSSALDKNYKKIPGLLSWSKRAEAWDEHLSGLRRVQWEQRILDARESDWQAAQKLRERAMEMLDSHMFRPTLSEVSTSLVSAAKMSRLATGEPTESVEVRDKYGVTDEERAKKILLLLDAARARRDLMEPSQPAASDGGGEGGPVDGGVG